MAQLPPVPPRETTLAIVLGASSWPRHPLFLPMPAFRTSLEAIADYLLDPEGFALPAGNVKVMIDGYEEAPAVGREMRRFLRDRRQELLVAGADATDLLIFYVGHGGFAEGSNTFFFSIRTTDRDDPLTTSITAASLGGIIREAARGLRSYLVLDCCFAAAAFESLQSAPLDLARLQLEDTLPAGGDEDVDTARGELPGYGVALLCASGRREAAKAPAGLAYTMFTGALLSVLRQGDSKAPSFLSLGDLHDSVKARLQQQFSGEAVLPELHLPQQRQGRLDRVRLFRNPARMTPSPPPVPPTRNAFWAGSDAPAWAHDWGTDAHGPWASFTVPSIAGTPLSQRMRWAPPGYFLMGSARDEAGHRDSESPQHIVSFPVGFWIFETPCTEELWLAVTGQTPDPRRGPTYPIGNVSWNDAQAFIEKLNALCPGISLTLPSEAQWEYACRAGSTTRFSFGDDVTPALARYRSNGPLEVASLPCNDWGLYEMHGNVWEWCADHWHQNYDGAPGDGLAWGSQSMATRECVLRGGAWLNGPASIRSASRYYLHPDYRFEYLSFRCTRVQAAGRVEAPAGWAGAVQRG